MQWRSVGVGSVLRSLLSEVGWLKRRCIVQCVQLGAARVERKAKSASFFQNEGRFHVASGCLYDIYQKPRQVAVRPRQAGVSRMNHRLPWVDPHSNTQHACMQSAVGPIIHYGLKKHARGSGGGGVDRGGRREEEKSRETRRRRRRRRLRAFH